MNELTQYDRFYRQGDYRYYPLAEKSLIQAIIKRVRKGIPTSRGKLLDVGCGTGCYSCLIARRPNLQVTGIDFSKVAIEIARRRCRNSCKFLVADFFDYPLSKKYDVVFCKQFAPLNIPGDLCAASQVTQKLVEHVKLGGYLVLCVSTNFTNTERPKGLFNHDLPHFVSFIRSIPKVESEYFITHRADQILLGNYCLNKFTTRLLIWFGTRFIIPGNSYFIVICSRKLES